MKRFLLLVTYFPTNRNGYKNKEEAVVEYLDYQIPVTKREMEICKQQSETKRDFQIPVTQLNGDVQVKVPKGNGDMQAAKRN